LILGVKNDQNFSKTGLEKNRRFVIFWAPFLSILSEMGRYRIYRKTGPTKSTVLGPGPPPWEFIEIYRILSIFRVFGVFNRAGKSVSKIGIYALPPLKSEFYSIFIYWGVTFRLFQHFLFGLLMSGIVFSLSPKKRL
jgi:hypothetical protein